MLKESTQRKLTLYLAPMLLFHVLLAWYARIGVRIGLADFTIFYTASEILHQGRGAELYNNGVQETLLFVPFARLKYLTAYLVWLAVNLGLTVALMLLLRKNFVVLGSAPLYLW